MPATSTRLAYFDSALEASNRDEWPTLVAEAYSHLDPSRLPCVLPLTDDAFQRNCVDYQVGLFNYADKSNPAIYRFCEVKSENYPAINISVETFSDVARGTFGWAFKNVSIRGQDLLTFFADGTVFHATLDDYRDFLRENRPRWEAEISEGNRTYRTFSQESHRDGRTWESHGFTIPLRKLCTGYQ